MASDWFDPQKSTLLDYGHNLPSIAGLAACPTASHYGVWLSSGTGITPIIHETEATQGSLIPADDLAPANRQFNPHWHNGSFHYTSPQLRLSQSNQPAPEQNIGT